MQMKAKLLGLLHVSSEVCLSGLQAGIACVKMRAARPDDRLSIMVTVPP